MRGKEVKHTVTGEDWGFEGKRAAAHTGATL